ncbi:hypothetical protein EDC04DRAFT_2909497 [Pisolithus marmoratus]|nr:hypothetical protein EDC04DRAFT_2909497 [Pisolithus marmoratus]
MDNSAEPEPMDDQWSEVAQEHPPPMDDQRRTLSEVAQEHPPILKRPSEDDWAQGHHAAKSSKADVTSVAPREDKSNQKSTRSTRREAEERAAHASQVNLLNTLKGIMSREPPKTTDSPGPTAATPSDSGSSRGSTPTAYSSCARTPPVSRGQSPAVSSDVQGSVTPSSNRQPLQQPTSIQAILDAQQHGHLPSSVPPDARRSTTPSSDTTQRPGRPSQAQQPASIQAILDAQQCGPDATRSKGKKRAAALSVSQAQLRQEEFHFQDPMLPTWPSVVVSPDLPGPSVSSSSAPGTQPVIASPNIRVSDVNANLPCLGVPSSSVLGTQPGAADPNTRAPNAFSNDWPPQGNPNPSGSGDPLAPLLSYFSQGLDTLLRSIQASQMTSHDALMKEVNDLRQQLNVSETASAAQLSNVQSCKTRKQYKFIPSNPGSPPTRQDKQEHHAFMNCIRMHTLTLLGITGYRHLRTVKCSLSQDEVDDYEKETPGCLAITPANFMVDCSRPRNSPFNKDAGRIFADDFLDKITNHSWYARANIPARYRKHEVIYEGFMSHLASIKSHFRVLLAEEEDQGRAKQQKDLRLQRSARSSRKIRLFKLRLDTIANDTSLKRHLALVKDLGSQGMSSDESEDENTRTISYTRVYPAWRSRQLGSLLWNVDDVAAINASVPIGKHKKSGDSAPGSPS